MRTSQKQDRADLVKVASREERFFPGLFLSMGLACLRLNMRHVVCGTVAGRNRCRHVRPQSIRPGGPVKQRVDNSNVDFAESAMGQD